MTLPYERTRAVLNTRDYLVRRATAGDDEARRLLKHYPNAVDMAFPESFDTGEVDRWIANWSLPACAKQKAH